LKKILIGWKQRQMTYTYKKLKDAIEEYKMENNINNRMTPKKKLTKKQEEFIDRCIEILDKNEPNKIKPTKKELELLEKAKLRKRKNK